MEINPRNLETWLKSLGGRDVFTATVKMGKQLRYGAIYTLTNTYINGETRTSRRFYLLGRPLDY